MTSLLTKQEVGQPKQQLFANHLKKLSLFRIMSLFLEVELTQPPKKNYQKLGAPKMAAVLVQVTSRCARLSCRF